jgi:DNA repair exonuclease SbcCD ATPase subunit
MNILSIILGFKILVGLPEIIIFQIGAIVLGFSIHFYWTSKKNIQLPTGDGEGTNGISEADEWKLKYFQQIDLAEKTESEYITEVNTAKQRSKELFRQIEELEEELRHERERQTQIVPAKPGDYLGGLSNAQEQLTEQNQQIHRLLSQIGNLKDAEQKHLDLLKSNELLNDEIRDLRHALAARESELKFVKRQDAVSGEMNERLQKTYDEFQGLREKLTKLQTYITDPANRNFDFQELQESYFRITKECDEVRLKHLSLLEENQRLSRLLSDTEDKLRESNFQRNQQMRKIGFLEELTADLQEVAAQQKKIEGQLRRIGELESLVPREPQPAIR